MNDKEDLDILVERATGDALKDIARLLEELTRLPPTKPLGPSKRRRQQERALKLTHTLDIFQEDPLLLDPRLKELLSPLAGGYLDLIQCADFWDPSSTARLLSSIYGLVIYHFCKVRGAKVITRLLSNEPRWVEPMLKAYATLVAPTKTNNPADASPHQSLGQGIPETSQNWQEEYVVLLWLGHLMYNPFDLASLSAEDIALPPTRLPEALSIPPDLPKVAMRVLMLALDRLHVADKRQPAAATLLVRLVVRPDMRALGLLNSLMGWVSQQLDTKSVDPQTSVHEYIGLLLLASNTLSAADVGDTARYLRRLFNVVHARFSDDSKANDSLTASAVAKKMVIKIQRNIILKAWNASDETAVDPTPILEDTIEFLLNSLADRDTQTRRAASKALSIITGKIDAEMGEEIVEAVIGCLGEDILPGQGVKSLQAVNALRWHGLVLTLGQMLFRRHPSPAQLPQILTALFRALSFEQRSAAGSSVGGNVRDAANFGLWSLARRYTTKELLQIDASTSAGVLSESQGHGSDTMLQTIAAQLVATACLDPVGNVRRGSSAALQELIGRHPDTIHQGIPLVQVVDYHAVGLRRRAMVDVARGAAALHSSYLHVLLSALVSWRGIESIDKASREHAAAAVGQLNALLGDAEAMEVADALAKRLRRLTTPGADVEERHGLCFALAACIDFQLQSPGSRLPLSLTRDYHYLQNRPFALSAADVRSIAVRPELTAAGSIKLLSSVLQLAPKSSTDLGEASASESLNSFHLALAHVAEEDYTLARRSIEVLGSALDAHTLVKLETGLLEKMRGSDRNYKGPAVVLALGAIWHHLPLQSPARGEILDMLYRRADTASDIETRVIAVRSASHVFRDQDTDQNIHFAPETASEHIFFGILEASLNDYTTTERGDVGSLLRCEALAALEIMPRRWAASNVDSARRCFHIATRLAVERLHRVRVAAWNCLSALPQADGPKAPTETATNITDVSTYDYFLQFALSLGAPTPLQLRFASTPDTFPADQHAPTVAALLEGLASSAGVGNDSVLDNARFALLVALEHLPEATLQSVCNQFLSLLRAQLDNERVLVPLLETLSFLLDAQALARLQPTELGFKWRTLLSLVQKAHYKSTNMIKLVAALNIYRCLAEVPAIRVEVVTKLVSMLAHRFPRIREGAAETLWLVTADESLKELECVQGAVPKATLDALKSRHAVAA